MLQLYDFISNNYETGDELFFFGFSRGAFTVRSAAGVVSDVGVFSSVNMSRFPEMWRAYRSNTGGEPFRKSEWYMDNKEKLNLTDTTIKVVGVWETVGSLVRVAGRRDIVTHLTDICTSREFRIGRWWI